MKTRGRVLTDILQRQSRDYLPIHARAGAEAGIWSRTPRRSEAVLSFQRHYLIVPVVDFHRQQIAHVKSYLIMLLQITCRTKMQQVVREEDQLRPT